MTILLVAQHEELHYGVYQRMCHLPDVKDQHEPQQTSPVPHHPQTKCTAIPNHLTGFHCQTP